MSLAYNEVTATDISKQLLLNIARARHNEPIHFSSISSIAATLNFQGSIGATPPLTGDIGLSLMPLFGGAAAENPTITIVPLQGEEFTKRLLAPLTEDKLTLLLRQNLDVDILLRLVALEFRTVVDGREEVFHNRPRDRSDYETFRRLVLHLSAIQDQDALSAEPLVFARHHTLPAAAMSAEGLQSLDRQYLIHYDAGRQEYHLEKEVSGRIVLTNYDPAELPASDRLRLQHEAELGADNDLLVDIRPGHPGGGYPIHGKFRLRSFSNILYFLGRTLSFEREFPVAPDPRTPPVSENPVSVLEIWESESRPDGSRPAVEYRGRYYSVRPDSGYPWNETAFRALWQIFQMTVAEIPKVGTPAITIAK